MKYISLLLSSLGILFVLSSCTPATPTEDFSNSGLTIAAPTLGSGKHIMVIFSDYQCPSCIAFHDAYDALLQQYARDNTLTLVYKQFPLYPGHKNALRDAYGALCAHAQGKFFEFSAAMYALEKSKDGLAVSDAERGTVAQGAGVPNLGAFNTCLAANTYAKQVYEDRAEGNRLNVPGTPSIFLDGQRLDGKNVYPTKEVFQKFLESYINAQK